jgi:hypothetical protein
LRGSAHDPTKSVAYEFLYAFENPSFFHSVSEVYDKVADFCLDLPSTPGELLNDEDPYLFDMRYGRLLRQDFHDAFDRLVPPSTKR